MHTISNSLKEVKKEISDVETLQKNTLGETNRTANLVSEFLNSVVAPTSTSNKSNSTGGKLLESSTNKWNSTGGELSESVWADHKNSKQSSTTNVTDNHIGPWDGYGGCTEGNPILLTKNNENKRKSSSGVYGEKESSSSSEDSLDHNVVISHTIRKDIDEVINEIDVTSSDEDGRQITDSGKSKGKVSK